MHKQFLRSQNKKKCTKSLHKGDFTFLKVLKYLEDIVHFSALNVFFKNLL